MVLRPDGALVETTGVDDELPRLSRDSPRLSRVAGDSTDPGMSVLTRSRRRRRGCRPRPRLTSPAAQRRAQGDGRTRTRRAGRTAPFQERVRPEAGPRSDEEPVAEPVQRDGASDSPCSLGVYDSQFWSSVLDNGPDVLGSDPGGVGKNALPGFRRRRRCPPSRAYHAGIIPSYNTWQLEKSEKSLERRCVGAAGSAHDPTPQARGDVYSINNPCSNRDVSSP